MSICNTGKDVWNGDYKGAAWESVTGWGLGPEAGAAGKAAREEKAAGSVLNNAAHDGEATGGSGGSSGAGSKLLWTSWKNYPKVVVDNREYAQIGDRLYSQHAVDRMQPSGLGAPAGSVGAGRNIPPNMVEYVINNGIQSTQIVNVVTRTIYSSGDVSIVTENAGRVVVTVLRK